MRRVRLGSTDLEVSAIAYGGMSLTPERARQGARAVATAFELGVNFFDTAFCYGYEGESEKLIGRGLGHRRDEVVIATKVFFPMTEKPNMGGLSRKHIQQACDASLKRLGVDVIDLYQIHRLDPHTPIEETLAALDHLVTQGKVRYIGASSMYAWEFMRALALSDQRGLARFVTMQNHYNLVYREEEREMLPLCEAEEVSVIPWSPLARGMLAGTRTTLGDDSTTRSQSDRVDQILYDQPSDWDVVEAVKHVAAQRGEKPAQVALAWLLAKPAVAAPILGATKLTHLDDALEAVEKQLSEEEIGLLEAPYKPHPVKGIQPGSARRRG